jgi:hypothetical protein
MAFVAAFRSSRTQGRVLPYRAATPAQMKERDAVVRTAATGKSTWFALA